MDMNDLINFDDIDNEIEESGGSGEFGAMEKHENQFMITSAEFKQGNAQSYYVEVVFDVIGDRYTNRKIWANYYLIKKDGTENIVAKAIYGKLCKAVGLNKEEMNNVLNLHQKMVSGDVTVKKGSKKDDGSFYDDSNEIANFKPIGGTTEATPAKTESAPANQGDDAQSQVEAHSDNPFA